MPQAIDDQVVAFYDMLFGRIFSAPFERQIAQAIQRRAVTRQVEEAADAASQSLTRFLRNQKLTERQVAVTLKSFAALSERLKLDDIANANITPEALAEDLLSQLPCPPHTPAR